jgi:hypothetical protein
MFDDWMNVWRETVDSFDRELHGDGGDGASRGMRRQLVAARTALARIQTEVERAVADAARERDTEQVCLRRQSMALGIADEETARIAGEYAGRHAERADLYERKAAVLREEQELMRRDLDVMESEFSARLETAAGDDSDDDALEGGKASPLDEEDRAAQDRQDLELARLRRERAASEKLEELKRRMRS